MEIKLFVQARKDGYNSLYPKQTPSEFFKFAGDLRPVSNSPEVLGKSLYTIAFTNGGVIFTKHIIIQDVQRQGLGNVGFSIFIPNDKKLSGQNVINLLDELVSLYHNNYCPDFNLGNVQEDWTPFENIVSQYNSKLNGLFVDDVQKYQSGVGEAAFVYYLDTDELYRFFDSPYQEDYFPYKQVFFVDKNLEGKPENPLTALPHNSTANLTGKIDLENPQYKIKDFRTIGKDNVKIELKVNGRFRSNNDRVFRKDTISIKYSKDDDFYSPIEVVGKISDYKSEIHPFVKVYENKITIKDDVELVKRSKTFWIKVEDAQHNPISRAEFVCKKKFSNEKKIISNECVIFTGEEIGSEWDIWAVKDNLCSRPLTFVPKNQFNNDIQLTLVECKKVKFNVKEEGTGNVLSNFNIQWNDSTYKDSIGFFGDEIKKTHSLFLSCSGYQTATINYCPESDDNPHYVTLQKYRFNDNYKKQYEVRIDPKMGKQSGIQASVNESSMNNCKCDSKFGYKFIGWNTVSKPAGTIAGYHEAQFEELWWHKIPKKGWMIVGVMLLVIIAGVLFFTMRDNDEETITPKHMNSIITKYSNNLDSLNHYDTLWYNQKPKIEEKGFWKWTGLQDATLDSTKYKQWKDINIKFVEAIKKCESSSNNNKGNGQVQQDSTNAENHPSSTQAQTQPKQSRTQQSGNAQSISSNQAQTNQSNQSAVSQKTVPDNQITERIDKFWALVHKDNVKKTEFDALFVDKWWKGVPQNAYHDFYVKYLSVDKDELNETDKNKGVKIGYQAGFKKIRILDRKNIKDLPILENKIKEISNK